MMLLVAVVAVAVVAGCGIERRRDEALAKYRVATLRVDIMTYYDRCGVYPLSLEALLNRPSDLPGTIKWDGPFTAPETLRDPWGKQYEYSYPGSHGDKFDVWTVTPNGKTIASWQRTPKR